MSVILNKITEPVVATIGVMSDVDVQFVSLVNHASTAYPVKFIRSNVEIPMLDVIQSIVVPPGVSLDDLKSDAPWLSDLDVQRVEPGEYFTKHVHRSADMFQDKRLSVTRMAKGALLLSGQLIEPDTKAMVCRADKVERTVDGTGSVGVPSTLSISSLLINPADFMYSEFSSFMDAFWGTLEMRGLHPTAKLESVGRVIDAFKSHVALVLTSLGATAAQDPVFRFDVNRIAYLKGDEPMLDETKVAEMINRAIPGALESFESSLGGKIKETLDSVLTQRAELERAEIARVAAETEAQEKESANRAIIAELTETVKELKEKVARFEESDSDISGTSAGTTTGDPVQRSADEKKDPVFRGVLFRRSAAKSSK